MRHISIIPLRFLASIVLTFVSVFSVTAQIAEVIPSINIVVLARNQKSLALGGLANIVHENAYGVQIGGLYNHIGDMGCGVTIGGLANTTFGHHYGVQIGGLYNHFGDMGCGVTIGGLANATLGHHYGVQIGGLCNYASDAKGLMLGGLGNMARGKFDGLQLAGLGNIAGDVCGVQFAGLFNVAKRVKGVQFAGIVNVAEESNFPIGLINIIKQGHKGVALTHDMLGNTLLAFRSGGKYTYGILGVGYNPHISDKFVAEAGYGLRIPLCHWMAINNEFKATAMGFNADNAPCNFSYLLAPSVTLWEHCNLFVGPSVNFLMSGANEADTLPLGKRLWSNEHDTAVQHLYIGYQVGIQYVF